MSILNVPASLPPGFIGNPYTPADIGVFYDLNWPDHAGMIGQGLTQSGLGQLRGLGQTCVGYDEDGNCDSWDSTTSGPPAPIDTPAPITTPAPNVSCDSVSPSAMTAQQLINCGYTTMPLNTPVTPAQAGLTAAQQAQLIAATGNSAVSLIRTAAGGPYTVAGTNLVYNPATGQLTTAAATNATATLTAGLAGIGPYVPLILAAIAAVFILPSILGKK